VRVASKTRLQQPRSFCQDGAARLADVWEPAGASSARKEAVRRAFANTGKGYAAPDFAATSRLLDEYVARWLSMYRDACEATHVRGEQSAEVFDVRMACLDGRLGNLRALSEVFTNADDRLDRIVVGRVRRQVNETNAVAFTEWPHARIVMRLEVVHPRVRTRDRLRQRR
jgi:hypothetical protein